jgi:uncharacterized protein (TIGR02246 family)
MKSLNWGMLRRYICVIVLADKLRQSWTTNNPALIVGTYANDAYLLPTCDNGPAIGRDEITVYFRDKFLPEKPVATFNLLDPRSIRIGGDCEHPFASGRYTFALGDDRKQVKARFTYVFQETAPNSNSWLIIQHHSSLDPKGSDGNPKPECPAH